MPIARFQMPDGRIGRFEVPDGTTPDQAQEMISKHLETQPEKNEPPKPKGSELLALPAGINSILPGTLGLPVDTATNLQNLGRSAYGMGRQLIGRAMGESPSEAASHAPEPLPPQAGGSQWFADKISGAIGSDVFSNPRPDSRTAQMLHTGGAVAASAAFNPASSVKTALTNVGKTVPSAVGAAVGEQVSPNNPLAPIAGALVAPTAAAGARAATARLAAPSSGVPPDIRSARRAGYVIPPSDVDPSFTNTTLESVSGKTATEYGASQKNQNVTNRLVTEELTDSARPLGIRIRSQLTEQALEDVRSQAGQVYQKIKSFDQPIKSTPEFKAGIKSLAGDFQEASQQFPDIIKNPEIEKLISGLSVEEMSSTAAVQLSKSLRKKATANLKSFDNQEKIDLGMAQRQAANLVEDLVSSNLHESGNGSLAKQWEQARSLIAKTHDIESALTNRGNVDASAFAKMLDKGKPLTGKLKDVAEFAANFPKAVRLPEKIGSPVSKLQAATSAAFGLAGGLATGGPGAGLAAVPLMAPPLARSLLLSDTFQNSLEKPSFRLSQSPTFPASMMTLSEREQR